MFTHYKAFCVEKQVKNCCLPLREKCPYSELFWFIFSRIRTEYWEILSISPYLVQMRENTDQSNSEHGHFLLSVHYSQSKLEARKPELWKCWLAKLGLIKIQVLIPDDWSKSSLKTSFSYHICAHGTLPNI